MKLKNNFYKVARHLRQSSLKLPLSFAIAMSTLTLPFPAAAAKADLRCSGWHIVFGGLGTGMYIESITPPFSGALNLSASIQPECIENCGIGPVYKQGPKGNLIPIIPQPRPKLVPPKYFAIEIKISWIDSNGSTKWDQKMWINSEKQYSARWKSSTMTGNGKEEQGVCEGTM